MLVRERVRDACSDCESDIDSDDVSDIVAVPSSDGDGRLAVSLCDIVSVWVWDRDAVASLVQETDTVGSLVLLTDRVGSAECVALGVGGDLVPSVRDSVSEKLSVRECVTVRVPRVGVSVPSFVMDRDSVDDRAGRVGESVTDLDSDAVRVHVLVSVSVMVTEPDRVKVFVCVGSIVNDAVGDKAESVSDRVAVPVGVSEFHVKETSSVPDTVAVKLFVRVPCVWDSVWVVVKVVVTDNVDVFRVSDSRSVGRVFDAVGSMVRVAVADLLRVAVAECDDVTVGVGPDLEADSKPVRDAVAECSPVGVPTVNVSLYE